MAYAYTTPSRTGIDGRKAGKCVSLMTGNTISRADLARIAKAKALIAKRNKKGAK